MDDNVLIGIAAIVSLVIALSVHEWAHALVATWRGDTTAKDQGRLTLNPIRHIHPVMTIAMPAFLWFVLPLIAGTPPLIFGGARPVPVIDSNLKKPARDMALVAIAGPLSNVALATLGIAALRMMELQGVQMSSQELPVAIVLEFVKFNILLAVFNLLPIPPLDGSRVASFLLQPLRPFFRALESWGLILVLAAVFLVRGLRDWLFDRMGELYSALESVVGWAFKVAGY